MHKDPEGKKTSLLLEIKSEPTWSFLIGQERLTSLSRSKQKLRKARVLVVSRKFQCPVLQKKVFIDKEMEKFISFQNAM